MAQKRNFTIGAIAAVVIVISILFLGFKSPASKYGTVSIGNQIYKTVKIGNQVWMAENLNLAVSGSSCYDFDPSKCVEPLCKSLQ